MKRLLAFLALCIPLYLFAQGFGSFSHDQPYFAKDVTGSTFPANLQYWWVSSDVTNSVGERVPLWIDRVQGYAITNGTATKQPTNRVDGVEFNGTQHLYYTPFWSGTDTNYATFISLTWTLPNRDYNIFYGHQNGTYSEFLGSVATATSLAAGARWAGKKGASYYPLSGGNPSSVPTNQWIVLATEHNVANGNGAHIHYCNGEPRMTNASYTIFSTIGGSSEASDVGLVGKVREVRVYTNTMTATEVSNISYTMLNP